MKTIIPLVVILALAWSGGSPVSFAQNAKPEGQSTGQRPSNERRVSVTLAGKTIHAVVADQEKTLLEGLLGWDRITDEEGMLLDFGRSGQYAIHIRG